MVREASIRHLIGFTELGRVIVIGMGNIDKTVVTHSCIQYIQQRGRKKIIQRLLLENEEFGFSEKRGTRMLRRIRRAGVCFSFEEEDVQ